MNPKGQPFGELLLEVIDDSLSVLGEQPRLAVFQYLMTMHSIQREEIPDKPEEFAFGLRKALGGASSVIERLILKKLFQRIGSTFRETQNLEFGDYINDARRRFEIARQRHGSQEEFLDPNRSKKSQVSG